MTLQNVDKAPFPWPEILVTPDGYVWRIRANGRDVKPRRIDAPDCSKGYRNVRLPLDGRWRTLKAQRVVWWWYNGDPGDFQIDHLNGDKADNRIQNLDLVTASTNIQRSYAHGRTRPWSLKSGLESGEWRPGIPMITPEQKDHAMNMRSQGATLTEVAAAIGCSVSHAHRITTAERRLPGE